MIKIENIKTSDSRYMFIESLLESAFPVEERRDRQQQRDYTDENALFIANVITDDNALVGLINYWNFADVYYIEHFAIDARLRSKGYGALALEQIKNVLNDKPIILEVEMPIGTLEKRRIDFYKRNGFALHEIEYKQPPYRANGSCLDMYLMSFSRKFQEMDWPDIISCIYINVYGVEKL